MGRWMRYWKMLTAGESIAADNRYDKQINAVMSDYS
jgi:hypothetical protein